MSGITILRVLGSKGAYDVVVGAGSLGTVGSIARRLTHSKRCALVTDDVVAGLHMDSVLASLVESGFDPLVCKVPAGECSKTWAEAGELLERFSACGLGRDSLVFALGGGVVGDLAGFVAAVYMRGIPVFQLPTTLLAQVDSSIGGKTGLDLPYGKNLVGAFWPPLAVIADTECLSTLPPSEWASGMAEVVKSAVLDGEESMRRLEADAESLNERSEGAVEGAVLMAASLKARVVSADERESAERESLNYGHTLGHAIERVAGYGAVSHGYAVAEGIRFATMVAELVMGASPEWSHRQDRLLAVLGLPCGSRPWEAASLLDAMYSDKKVRGGEVRMVLSDAPGSWTALPVDEDTLQRALGRWAAGSA